MGGLSIACFMTTLCCQLLLSYAVERNWLKLDRRPLARCSDLRVTVSTCSPREPRCPSFTLETVCCFETWVHILPPPVLASTVLLQHAHSCTEVECVHKRTALCTRAHILRLVGIVGVSPVSVIQPHLWRSTFSL